MKFIPLLLMLTLAGCSSFSMSIGIGYRSVPPTMKKPILYQQIQTAKALGFAPAWIDLILEFITSDMFKAMFHEKNRTDLGFWIDLTGD